MTRRQYELEWLVSVDKELDGYCMYTLTVLILSGIFLFIRTTTKYHKCSV